MAWQVLRLGLSEYMPLRNDTQRFDPSHYHSEPSWSHPQAHSPVRMDLSLSLPLGRTIGTPSEGINWVPIMNWRPFPNCNITDAISFRFTHLYQSLQIASHQALTLESRASSH